MTNHNGVQTAAPTQQREEVGRRMRAEEGGKHQRLRVEERITLNASRYDQLRSLSDPVFALSPLVYLPSFHRVEQVPFRQLGLPHATRNQRIWDTSGLKAQKHPELGKD
jgi:hypothetical protein